MKFSYLPLLILLLTLVSPAINAKKTYNADEYAGKHNAKNIRMALSSKGFSWLSGSPADNEKLAIGKSAQFFGFVALRYQSDRKAKRGNLGTTFYQLASPEQRKYVIAAAEVTKSLLDKWWSVRKELLAEFEQHLYTGEGFNTEKVALLGENFGLLNAEVGLAEAKACFALAKSLSDSQKSTLTAIRTDPTLANKAKEMKPLTDNTITSSNNRENSNQITRQTEAIFAKCFSLITGTFADRQVVPLGQPAQFFGFVSLRQKSGRGVKRGKIANQFNTLLTAKQKTILNQATAELLPVVNKFMVLRDDLMKEMDKLGSEEPTSFSVNNYSSLAKQLGKAEIYSALIEAKAYRLIRTSFTPEQQNAMMTLRNNYDLHSKVIEPLTSLERGKQLYNLCLGCHEGVTGIAPELTGIVNRKAATSDYSYSAALLSLKGKEWTELRLNSFLKSPQKVAPGTSMEFTGLLNQKDRVSLIEYLKAM